MEVNLMYLRLSQLLPREVKLSILNALTQSQGPEELAKDLRYSTITVERWLDGDGSIDVETSKFLILALQRSADVRALLSKFYDEIALLFDRLNIIEKQRKMDILMDGLDEESRWIVQYFIIRRHANIRELAHLIEASSDMEVLFLLKEIINPKAEKIFEEPLVNFERFKIDPLTCEKVSFSWWLSENFVKGLGYNNVSFDVFDEGNYLTVIANLPSNDWKDIDVRMKDGFLIMSTGGNIERLPLPIPVEGIDEETYNNGILEVKLKKVTLKDAYQD